ncbi:MULTISPECIES: LysR family transcriptional regulator [unclassified Amycolatopsis]|uniref:LysR family transcriptional regulator n=1 Tax=unclassified Amycolatopsis TaxID=2618356 RepID=UPI002E0F8C0C|nr:MULTISPECIES: LysR family transcriptional regulator [unclassified Amycolatopsis]WSJ78361.1 LysR family transcriptional regulator [Amycolatopsis sp. NBC_01307]WSK78071.1 LysR family transcriptional regulator [Amycolatopsis sp. NBC_01286]
MELELRHLRALVAVADTRSLTRAARVLRVSQPALSGLLRRVERSVGGLLFVRSPTGCVPTPLGADVVAEARTVLAGVSALTERIGEQRAPAGPLRVGGYCGFLHLAVSRWLRDQPWCHGVSVQEDQDEAVALARVAAGSLDLALVYLPPLPDAVVPDGVGSVVVHPREPVFVILAHDHPLARSRTVPFAGLAEHPWADDPPGTTRWSAYLQRVCRRHGVALDQPHRPQCLATLQDLVRAGMAVAPALATREDLPATIVVRAIEGAPLWQELRLCYRPGTPVAARIGEIHDAVVRVYAGRQGCSAAFDHWWRERGRELLPAG